MTDIIISKSDKRQYKVISLPNTLQCLLISDPEADKSAAALDVKVGCSLDQKPLYGTAHFLEHMLFMGTKKFPEENEYATFILNNGGSNNAFTSLTDTNYHFDISNDAFGEALDRFSQFFISPNFKETSAEREMKAVDSEFNQSLQSDAWKFFNILQRGAHENSTLNRFNCGNLETLQQEGIRDALLAFHQKWYSSNIMKLVLTGKHSLEQLEKWATELFEPIPNINVVVPDLGSPAPYDEKNLAHIYRFVPVKDKDIMTFYWFLPYSQREYKTQPLKYHAHLFGHEGTNSLLGYLISEGLALELSCGYDHELWSYDNFYIDITLTQKGMQEYDKITEAVFKYAQVVRDRGVQEYIFDEIKRMGEIEFDFADKKHAMTTCVKLAGKMQVFEAEQDMPNLIKHQYIVEHLDKEKTQEMSNLICDPNNMNIYIRSKKFEGQLDLTDYWYKTKYDQKPFSEELLIKMKNPNVVINKKKLDLPPKNTLLPKNLDILPKDPEFSEKPTLIQQWDDTDLWYKKDDKFDRPKAIISCKYYTNDVMFGRSATGRVFIEMWNSVLQEYLREFYYMASMASLNASFSIYQDNYNMQWSGFNDSMGAFIEETIKQIKELKMSEQKEFFDQCKERLLQDWYNFYFEQTYRIAFTTIETVLVSPSYEKKTLRKLLEKMTFEDFVEQSQHWFKTGRFVWFVNGNFAKDEAIKMIDRIRTVINIIPTDKEDLSDVRCMALSSDVNYLLEMPLEDKENENNCLVTYFEHGLEGSDLKSKMVHDVLMQYLDEPTFNQLRTIEQLGYVVFSRPSTYRDVMGTQFIIQSPKESCEYIVNSLNNFLKSQIEKVKNISDEDFKTQVDAVMVKVVEKDYNLAKENNRFWSEIATHKYIFDRQEKEIEALKQITKQAFSNHFETLFFSKQTKRLDFELTSAKHEEKQNEHKVSNKEAHYKDIERVEVKDSLVAFKKKMPLHPDNFKAAFATHQKAV